MKLSLFERAMDASPGTGARPSRPQSARNLHGVRRFPRLSESRDCRGQNPESVRGNRRAAFLLPNCILSLVAVMMVLAFVPKATAADKKILLIAGKPSHGPGDH